MGFGERCSIILDERGRVHDNRYNMPRSKLTYTNCGLEVDGCDRHGDKATVCRACPTIAILTDMNKSFDRRIVSRISHRALDFLPLPWRIAIYPASRWRGRLYTIGVSTMPTTLATPNMPSENKIPATVRLWTNRIHNIRPPGRPGRTCHVHSPTSLLDGIPRQMLSRCSTKGSERRPGL